MAKKGTQTRPTIEGIANPVIQTMACTMYDYSYMGIREIYEDYNLAVTPIEKNVLHWQEDNVLTGQRITRYGYSADVHVNFDKWVDVMRTIDPDTHARLCRHDTFKSEGPIADSIFHFSTAFIKYQNGQPYEEELEKIVPADFVSTRNGIDLLHTLVKEPKATAFVQRLNRELLISVFNRRIFWDWFRLDPIRDLEPIRQVFMDNPCLPDSLRHQFRDAYLYQVEFLQSGKIDEVMKKMVPGSLFHRQLTAIKLLHEGKATAAYEMLAAILKEEKEDYFYDGLLNFTYGLALIKTGTPKARKTIEKLLKSRKANALEECIPMLLVLHHHQLNDARNFYLRVHMEACKDRMSQVLSTLFMTHYQLLEKEPDVMAKAKDWVIASGYNYLRLLFADDINALRPIAEKLCKDTGLKKPLLPKVKRLEIWEKVIEQVSRMSSTRALKAEGKNLEKERVAYVVDLQNLDVQPKLQKSKDNGVTWSKGRNISLSKFAVGDVACMTPQDHKVSKLVESYSYGWYKTVEYKLGGEKVIAALKGHPAVYSAKNGLRIDIVDEPLQLTVSPRGNKYVVLTNVNLKKTDAAGGINITKSGDKQVSVTEISSTQKKMLDMLTEASPFPKESEKQLSKLLQQLSKDFMVMSPLLKNSTTLKHVEASSLIAVQIAPMENLQFSISLAVKPFGSHPPYQQPGKGMEIVSATIDGEQVQAERDLQAERSNRTTLRKHMGAFSKEETDTDHWTLDTAQCLELLEMLRTLQEIAYVEWPQGERMRVVRPMITPDRLRLKISSASQWFELEGNVNIGEKEKIKMAELLERLHEGRGNFIRLGDNEYVALSEQLRKQLEAIDKMLIGRGKKLKIATMNGMQLTQLEEIGAVVKADEQFATLMQRIKESGSLTYPLPDGLNATLRPYQQEGYTWMSRLAHWGAGACLADDMGLGKTLQSIALLLQRAPQGAQLVLMPTSVLHNWQQELQRFAPTLKLRLLNQAGTAREKIVNEAGAGDVVLSTYGLLVTEGELLSGRTWTTIVLDEAHTIKNRDTQTSKNAMTLQGDFRLLLTGTPLQNHLSEIWNLFQFANPGLLGSYQQFADRFILPIERDHDMARQQLLRKILSPFLLRRTKDDVLNELPEKTEITVRVELSAEEQALYDNLRQQAIANLEEGTKSALQTLAEITKLRQAACHPQLVNKKLRIASSKTQAFLELVAELRQGGHRALVFSQFTSHLALIREALDKEQGPSDGTPLYYYLDGSTNAQERTRLVQKFQTSDVPLFLISLKAGGLGLNLTGADYVVHLDPWWNPAIEDQASDRAYRIGQERPVTVYRLIAANTIEEKIIRLHQHKRSLADALLQDADLYAQISAEDVIRLLKESVDEIK